MKPSPISAMVQSLEHRMARVKEATTPTPMNLTRLVRVVALLNIAPCICSLAAWHFLSTGHTVPGYAFLVAAVVMVTWIKNIKVPTP